MKPKNKPEPPKKYTYVCPHPGCGHTVVMDDPGDYICRDCFNNRHTSEDLKLQDPEPQDEPRSNLTFEEIINNMSNYALPKKPNRP